MDKLTIEYYNQNADVLYHTYQSAKIEIYDELFSLAFPSKSKILEIGAGSGRDMLKLLKMGHDVYGIDASERLVHKVIFEHPELKNRLVHKYFPELESSFSEKFDGILCSAVLMHIPKEYIFDSVYAIKNYLKEGGRVLISIPLERRDISENNRDQNGRLFILYPPDYLQLIFERAGFSLIEKRISKDSLGREEIKWIIFLFRLEASEVLKPLDIVEAVLNRDKKTATYKLALFRSLCDIARNYYQAIEWYPEGLVGIPINLIVERWIFYFWNLLNPNKVIPQISGANTSNKLRFQDNLQKFISKYERLGGYFSFLEEYQQKQNEKEIKELLKSIKDTILLGPVTYSGLSSEAGKVFQYDKNKNQVLLSAQVWKEISLMHHWIRDALILRWAELSHELSQKNISVGEIIALLLEEDTQERDVAVVRSIYQTLPQKECIWSGESLKEKFAVDHVIPYSLWYNNDLWNLLPANEKVNNQKRDKLPTLELIKKRKEIFIYYWRIIKDKLEKRFLTEIQKFCGRDYNPNNWENVLFASMIEGIETTAQQRGVERWNV